MAKLSDKPISKEKTVRFDFEGEEKLSRLRGAMVAFPAKSSGPNYTPEMPSGQEYGGLRDQETK